MASFVAHFEALDTACRVSLRPAQANEIPMPTPYAEDIYNEISDMADRWPSVSDRLGAHGFHFSKNDEWATALIPDEIPPLFAKFDGYFYSAKDFTETFAGRKQVLVSADDAAGLHDKIGHVGPWLLWGESKEFMDALHTKFSHIVTLDQELPTSDQCVHDSVTGLERRQRLAVCEARRILVRIVDLQIEACAQFSTAQKPGARALNYAAVRAILQQPVGTYRPDVCQILNATISEDMVASAQESVHKALTSS